MKSSQFHTNPSGNPLDEVSKVLKRNQWPFQREKDDEIHFAIEGNVNHYQLSILWSEEKEMLHLACGFEVENVRTGKEQILRLMAICNERIPIGRLSLWLEKGLIFFRESSPLNGGARLNAEQIQYLLNVAIESCEQYQQALQFMIWAGHNPAQALESASFETRGSA